MRAQHRGVGALVVVAAVSSALAVGPGSTVAAASGSFCSAKASFSGTTTTWTGKGNGSAWSDRNNWSSKAVPTSGQYVCIGDGKGGTSAAVTIAGTKDYQVSGIDIGQGAGLTINPGGELSLGATTGTPAASSVDKHSQLELDAATLGGNSPLTVAGTLRWTGQQIGHHKDVATQTGDGRTIIGSGGRMLVNGSKFGGTDLSGKRTIDNHGTITFSHVGYVAMDNGTKLIDSPHSSLLFDGDGGIFRGSKHGGGPPSISQEGAVVRDGDANDGVVVAVPITFSHKPAISIHSGSLAFDGSQAPVASARRATRYGVGICVQVSQLPCIHPIATAGQPQVALLGRSSESAAPKVSKVAVSLAKGPASVHHHRVLGKAIDVRAPTKKTTHSTHLTFMYDASTAGLSAHTKPIVYRGKHAITHCKVHGLTAKNTSCLLSATVSHSGQGTKGDLTVVLITIQPDAHWLVAR